MKEPIIMTAIALSMVIFMAPVNAYAFDSSEVIGIGVNAALDFFNKFYTPIPNAPSGGVDYGRAGDEGYDINLTPNTTPASPHIAGAGTFKIFGDAKNQQQYGDAAFDYMKENDITYDNPHGDLKENIDRLEDQYDSLLDDPKGADLLKKFDQLIKDIKDIKEMFKIKNNEEDMKEDDMKEAFDEATGDEAKPDLNTSGDPGIFSISGEACTVKRELGMEHDKYWRFNLFSSEPPILLPMERDLCPGTLMVAIDWNGNGKVDNGDEVLFSQERNVFERLALLDYMFGNYDGVLDQKDGRIWEMTMLAEQTGYNKLVTHTPESKGVKGFEYWNFKQYWNDAYGIGVYADNVYASGKHFRINSWAPSGVMLADGTTTDMYGVIMAPLRDCTIHDANYHMAEKQTGEYLRIEGTEDPTYLYEESLEYCMNFERVHMNPDKYQSHWIAGIASMEHKKGFENPEHYDIAEDLYVKALGMSPDNPFYNVDYCLLQYHKGFSTADCIGNVDQAVKDRPDVEWFAEARDIALRGAF